VAPCCLLIGVFTSGILSKSAEDIAALGEARPPKRRRFGLLRGR
jgi:hypothetical protein